MIESTKKKSNRPYWFVAAKHKNRIKEFVMKGFWQLFENEAGESMRGKYREYFDSMEIGDNIAIKHYGTAKNSELDLLISEGNVDTFCISAIGKIIAKTIDDRIVKVEWREKFEYREKKFYFFRQRDFINCFYLNADDWRQNALIEFAFHNVDQDIERFLQDKGHAQYAVNQETNSDITKGYDSLTAPAGSNPQLNTILYGPPGTGKTYSTARRCLEICDGSSDLKGTKIADRFQQLCDEERVEFVTFHESYGYEDFVEGLRPDPDAGSSGILSLLPVPGVLRRIAERACSNADLAHVLVIDEINRANISKVFGELVTLLEEDKRKGQPAEVSVTLPYSSDKFTLPANLYFLGTMNTADRSIALLDTALRRRFHFEEVPPDPQCLDEIGKIDLPNVLRKINERLEWLIDRDHVVGHAWLMGAQTKEQVDQIMRGKIIPLIAEYFHEDWSKVRAVLGGGSSFVERTKLEAPPGEWGDGEKRYRWKIKEKFSPDAYSELVNDGIDTGPESE